MRTIVTSCLAILLFSAVVSARLGDSATELPSTIPSTADVKNFLSGLWDAIGLGHDFDDFSTCIEVDTNAGTQLQKAMTLMGSPSASDVSHGLNKIDKVVSPMLAGIKACNMKDKYTTTINRIVNKFTNPGSLTIQADSSISINGVEVFADVLAAVDACNKGSFTACGTEIGEGMGKVYYGQDSVTSADAVAQINSIPNITWTAADFSQFNVMNLWEFKKAHVNLRRKKSAEEATPIESVSDDGRRKLATNPVAFDSRTKWPTCIHGIRDQGGCGNCWAFGASEVLSDRFCIASNKSINTVMSAQYLTSCDTGNFACNGGYLDKAWKFLETTGDVTDTCMPYKSGNGLVPACYTFTKCADNTRLRKYYAKVNSTRIISGIAAIQTEILTNGPVETGFDVYSDFMSYRSGIYTNTAGASYMGGHAVKIIGWGNSNGINYWIVANSWGTYWGESGFFRIQFGSCGIDGGVVAGLPDLLRQ